MSDKVLQRWCDAGGKWNLRVTFACLIYWWLSCRVYEDSYASQLLGERPESTATTALTRFVVGNAVRLAERCVSDTASSATDASAAAKRGKKKSHGIVQKFLNQVFSYVYGVM